MTVGRDPAVHETCDRPNPGQNDDAPEERPTFAAVHEGTSDRDMARCPFTIGSHPLDRFLTGGL